MSDRTTPETDAFAASDFVDKIDELTQLYDLAEKLERERDEAIKERDKMRTELEMWRDGNIMHQIHKDELEKAERERDEAREVGIAQHSVIKDLILERDEAKSKDFRAELRAMRYCQERDEARINVKKLEDKITELELKMFFKETK